MKTYCRNIITIYGAGFPVVLTKTFGVRTTSHQCGTARMGSDQNTSVVNPNLRCHEVANLWIADASVLPTSAAVNPALTISALVLRSSGSVLEFLTRILK